MKINVGGKTPMERLANLTRGLMAVAKEEIARVEKKRVGRKRRRKAVA